MAQYDVTYACGHSGTVYLTGKHSYREWKLERLKEDECLECFKARQFLAAQTETQERDLIPLQGSEKQVQWALSIRLDILAKLDADEDKLVQALPERDKRTFVLVVDALCRVDSAHQWIEWRRDDIKYILLAVHRQLVNAPSSAQVEREREEARRLAKAKTEAIAEATIKPEQPISDALAEISHTQDCVYVSLSERHDDFAQVVRRLGYTWDYEKRRWERKLRVLYTGPARDRAVELGQALLSRGFCLCVLDQSLREAIVAGTFEPEHTRWISAMVKGDHVGWFCVKWGEFEDYYNVARKIAHSRYEKPHVVIPPASFEQVLDFAGRYGFRLTTGAQEIADQARFIHEHTVIVKRPEVSLDNRVTVASTKPPVLAIPEQVEIAEEFSDADND
jgi:hypothetical protein